MMLTAAKGMKWLPAGVHKFPFALFFFFFFFKDSFLAEGIGLWKADAKIRGPFQEQNRAVS